MLVTNIKVMCMSSKCLFGYLGDVKGVELEGLGLFISHYLNVHGPGWLR